MARVGDTCVSIGNADWFRGDRVSVDPISILPRALIRSVVGNSIPISGDSSYSEDGEDTLYYDWSIRGPVGSTTDSIADTESSFRLDPDVVGEYIVELRVVGASGGCGNTAVTGVYAFSSASPHHEATALDMSFLWQLLPTAWSKIEYDARLKIELFWRGLSQLVGAGLTELMSVDASKSALVSDESVAARHVRIPLTFSLADAYISPPYERDVSITALSRRSLRVSSAPRPEATYQLNVIVVSENAFSVRVGADFQPYPFDVGAQVSVDVNGVPRRFTVSGVSEIVSGQSVYTIAPSAFSPEMSGAEIQISLTPSRGHAEEAFTITQGGAKRVILTSPRRATGGSQHVSAGYLEIDAISAERTLALRAKGAWDSGVRANDIARVIVRDLVSRSEVDVDLLVDAVLSAEPHDVISVVPMEGVSFSTLLDTVCAALLPGVARLPAELAYALSSSLLPRAAGRAIPSSTQVALLVDSQPVLIEIELDYIALRSATRTPRYVSELSVLREFIEIHDEDPSGEYVITEANQALYLGRRPAVLLENSDFTVDASGSYTLEARYSDGEAYLTSTDSVDDLLSVGYRLRDPLSVKDVVYTVVRVEGERIYVAPLPETSLSARPFSVYSPTGEGWARFSADALPYPIIDALHAEAVTVSRAPHLESYLGEATGLTHRAWEALNINTSYGDVLRAMLVGYIAGPTIHNLESAASAVMGAPMTRDRVVVRSITYNFRSIQQVTYAKVIAESVDIEGAGSGILYDYLVPTYAEHALPGTLSDTLSFAEGDILEAGVCLTSVIRVEDFALREHQATQRHRFDVRVASGAVPTSPQMVELLSRYLDEVKPAHTDYAIKPIHFLRDDIEIESDVEVRLIKELYETPYGLHGPAEVLDDYIPGIGRVDTRPFLVLSTWFPNDAEFVLSGDTPVLRSAQGGFINAPSQYRVVVNGADLATIKCEYDAGEWIRVGDAVILTDAPDSPIAKITRIVNDGELELDRGDLHEFTPNDRFAIVRFIDDVLLDEQLLSSANDANLNIIELGARASNVTRGDVVCFNTGLDAPRPIARMVGTRAVLATLGYPRLSSSANTAGSHIQVRRPWVRPIEAGSIALRVEDAGAYYVVSSTSGDTLDMLGLSVGDRLDGAHDVIAILPTRVSAVVHKRSQLQLGESVFRVENPSGIDGADALDLADRGVRSSVMMSLRVNEVYRIGDDVDLLVDAASQVGQLLKDDVAAPGDIILVESVERPRVQMLNVGEGAGAYRVLNVAIDGALMRVSLNVDLSVHRQGRVALTIVKQSGLSPTLMIRR